MSEYLHLDEITWPEVAALPRETPLLLPLGSLAESGTIHEILQTDGPAYLLPTIPFGWRGSGLEVEASLFKSAGAEPGGQPA